MIWLRLEGAAAGEVCSRCDLPAWSAVVYAPDGATLENGGGICVPCCAHHGPQVIDDLLWRVLLETVYVASLGPDVGSPLV